ncbi:MAG: response regulator receiver modulated diguanylate cyclase [Deltaproteobacteria bacterium]|nr:response regulator receiver modulated diguanylate cyclase [Deltaproteobacteria bacterium]
MDKRKVRLLVVDDEEAIRGTLSALLGEEGYEVTAVSSAEEAIARLGDAPFHLVITDIRMSGMTGIELLQAVKRLHPATEVIMMTSYASLETAVLALRSGAYDYLLKPFEDLELVTTAVARAVEKGVLVRERNALVEALAMKNRELSEINAFLAERANRDGLTGLYNHRYFQEALARETALCERHGRDLSLIFGDVDHFKRFNDMRGHQTGDMALFKIAAILQKCVRISDVVARYGGEEFVVLLPDTTKEDARVVAEKIRAAIESHPFPGGEHQPGGKLTISLGLSSFPEDGRDPDTLIKGADSALYAAKSGGRNVIRTHG